ncbi:MAG TPA: hypothetical protein PKN54_02335 [Candidatus Cloacimonas acidaminovorans]|nr:hypothetical protein [Candidatus Cloacimonas acidaminovorans]
MTNLSILSQFFNERIKVVDGNTKPLLQKLKNICERRATNQISEQKALIELDKLSGNGFKPVINGLNISSFSKPIKPINLLAGTKSLIGKKSKGVIDFNNVAKRKQFPVFGLRPVASNSNKKKFVLSPMSRSWFDVKDFKKSEPVLSNFKKSQSNDKGLFGDIVSTRVNDSNRAMKSLFDVSKSNFKSQPVLNNFKDYKSNTPLFGSSFVGAKSPRKGKRVYPKRKQSVAEMMGVKL